METDDKVRGAKGVVVCLRDMGNGTSRLFLDDVNADREINPIKWSHDHFYTFTPELPNPQVDAMQLSDVQLQQIGTAVVARLVALERPLHNKRFSVANA